MMKLRAVTLLLSLSTIASAAAIHGVVSNETTGKPQAGVQVTLMKLEQGMVPIGSVKSGPDGTFTIEAPPPTAELPYLVRGDYQDIAYHAAARDASSEVRLKVYEKTTDHSAVKLATEQMIVEPRSGALMISEIYTISNETSPGRTLAPPSGKDKDTFHFAAAKGLIQNLIVTVSGPSQMPLKQVANEHESGVYGLDFPIRPGETKVEVTYRFAYDGKFTFEKPAVKSLLAGDPEIAVIAPLQPVELGSPNLTLIKEDKAQGAAFYGWNSTSPLFFTVSGVMPEGGAQQSTAPDAGGQAGAASAEDLATVENQNFVYQSRWKILIVLGSALLLGLAFLYRTGAPPAPPAKSAK